MCQAFKELFKEEIQEEIDKALADKDVFADIVNV